MWKCKMGSPVVWVLAVVSALLVGCSSSADSSSAEPVVGCDGQVYMDPATSPYVAIPCGGDV